MPYLVNGQPVPEEWIREEEQCRPTAGQLRPRILRLIRADALAARGRIHPGLLGKEPSSTKYNPAPSLQEPYCSMCLARFRADRRLLGHWPRNCNIPANLFGPELLV